MFSYKYKINLLCCFCAIFVILLFILVVFHSSDSVSEEIPIEIPVLSTLTIENVEQVWMNFGEFPAYEICNEDIQTLIAALAHVTSLSQNNDFDLSQPQYAGMMGSYSSKPMFQIKLSDDTSIDISVYPLLPTPYIKVDDNYYATEQYSSCKAIEELYFSLIETVRSSNMR